MTGPTPEIRVLGVRHHGPGSARAVRRELEDFNPEVVLIEGPSDADGLVAFAADEDLVPPVALLAYAVDDPRTAAFWPFALFSPEWQALRWAVTRKVPVRFCDLPAATVLAQRDAAPDAPVPVQPAPADDLEEPDTAEYGDADLPRQAREDPIALLASAAGYDDPERWWEDMVESRLEGEGPFVAICEAMGELRQALPADSHTVRNEQREAFMRQVLRAAVKEGHARIAVVCGAWHAPALSGKLPPAAADARQLKNAARRKVAVTWVPWTHGRLAAASGYGASVQSPGWYQHLFTAVDRPIDRWLTTVATVLREEDLPVSTAHIIEAVRLTEMLTILRGRPLAGLDEVTEATRSVLVDGDDVALELVTRRLVVGEALGSVPDSAPTVPLETDLRAQAKRLRLKLDPVAKSFDLDLRKPFDLDRSQLLHRLRLLGIGWGVPAEATTRNLGTFRESWQLLWQPELVVDLVEASLWGTTVESAATQKVGDQAARRDVTLPELTALVEAALLAELPDALPAVLRALDARAAVDTDVTHLMDGLPALMRSLRYGDVRQTSTADLATVADALLLRICTGLAGAVTALDDEAADAMRKRIDAVHTAVALRRSENATARWTATLLALADRSDLHGLLAGRMVRLLLDAAELDTADAGRRLSRALSAGVGAPAKAGWIEGFLSGGGALLVHDTDLLGLLDDWVTQLSRDAFTDVLPLLRHTFSSFAGPERQTIAATIRRGDAARRPDSASDDAFDEHLAAATLTTTARLLGARA